MIEQRKDGRLCVHQSDLSEMRTFNIDRVFMSIVEAGAVFRQIESFIRNLNSGAWYSEEGCLIDDYRVFEEEPTDDPRLCIVWNPETKQIRFAAIGLDLFQAEIAAHHGALYMDALSMNPIQVWNGFYGVENGGTNDS